MSIAQGYRSRVSVRASLAGLAIQLGVLLVLLVFLLFGMAAYLSLLPRRLIPDT